MKPSKKSRHACLGKVREITNANKSASQTQLIGPFRICNAWRETGHRSLKPLGSRAGEELVYLDALEPCGGGR